jgi:hypothetical protein
MGLKRLWVVFIVLIVAACSGDPVPEPGLRLVEQNTVAPSLPVPTRALSNTPSVTPIAFDDEIQSPLEDVTVEADLVLVTPTLPPSKTPTTTPSITPTLTITPSPTMTVTATATRPLFPTSVIIPATAPVAAPVQQICDTQWFFIEPRPAACPLTAPTASNGVYQEFENGFMIWVGLQDAIFVIYKDDVQPSWQVFPDPFEESMPHDDPRYAIAPRDNIWQPRRGFGLLWRENEALRTRIGWAMDRDELPFSVQTQQADDGQYFISTPGNRVFGLLAGGTGWTLYNGFGGFRDAG